MIIILLVFSLLSSKISFCMEHQSLPDHLSLELTDSEAAIALTAADTIAPNGAEQDETKAKHPTRNAQKYLEYLQAQKSQSGVSLCCEICNTELGARRNLIRHLQTIHQAVEKNILCEHPSHEDQTKPCIYATSRQDLMDRHLKSSHSHLKIDCKYCNLSFYGKPRFDLHAETSKHKNAEKLALRVTRPDAQKLPKKK